MDSKSQSHPYHVEDVCSGAPGPTSQHAPRITVVFAGALGDTLLLRPVLEQLRTRSLGCSITLVAADAIGKLFASLGWADMAIDINRYDHHGWFGTDHAGVSPPWAACDWLISGVSSGNDSWAAAAQCHSTAGRISYFDPRPQGGSPDHVVMQWCRQLGISNGWNSPAALGRLRSNWKPAGCTVVIQPGSGGREKCWPLTHFKAVARRLRSRGFHPQFILGPVESERMAAKEIIELQREFDVLITHDLFELAARLASALAFCGNDSGVTHLAAAMGVPTLAIFIRSNLRWWSPVGPEVRVLAAAEVLT